MAYLIGKMVFCLLLASIFSAIIGWYLKQFFATKQYNEQLNRFTTQSSRDNKQIAQLKSLLENSKQENIKLLKIVNTPSQAITELTHEKATLVSKNKTLRQQNKQITKDRENYQDDLSRLAEERTVLETAQHYLNQADDEEVSDPCAMGCLKEQLVSLMDDRDKVQATISQLVTELSNEQQCHAELKQNKSTIETKIAATDEPDDLQKIIGIGKANEQVLKEQGITCYAQIAAFTTEEEQKYGNTLGVFSARIAQEEWVKQAKQLHKEKYEEDI
jgi:predicted flap endonuclease-1-like 5' DNA nuclease